MDETFCIGVRDYTELVRKAATLDIVCRMLTQKYVTTSELRVVCNVNTPIEGEQSGKEN